MTARTSPSDSLIQASGAGGVFVNVCACACVCVFVCVCVRFPPVSNLLDSQNPLSGLLHHCRMEPHWAWL